MRKRPKMKISKTKLRQIIKEELQRVLSEGRDDLPAGAGSTIYGPRAGAELAGQRSDGRKSPDLDKTQEIDMAPHFNSADPWPAAATYRPEAERLFNKFFGSYDLDALELLLHEDPDLKDIVRHLYGWDLNMFPKMREPDPAFVMTAQSFEKEGKDIFDNEDEFLDRLQPIMYKWGKERFAAQMKQNKPAAGSAKMAGASYPGTREDAELRRLLNVSGLNTDK
jgi:hypothetical protein